MNSTECLRRARAIASSEKSWRLSRIAISSVARVDVWMYVRIVVVWLILLGDQQSRQWDLWKDSKELVQLLKLPVPPMIGRWYGLEGLFHQQPCCHRVRRRYAY